MFTKTVTCNQADFNSDKCEVSLHYEHYSEDAPKLSLSKCNLWVLSISSEGINYTWDKVFEGWKFKDIAEDLYTHLSNDITVKELRDLGFEQTYDN